MPRVQTATNGSGSSKGEGAHPQSDDWPPHEIFGECNWTFGMKIQ